MTRSQPYNLAQAVAELDRLSNNLQIPPPAREMAATIYRRALEHGLVRARSVSVVTAASLYVACRITRTPRTLREISDQSPVDKKHVSRCYGLMLQELNITIPKPDPQLMVPMIAAKVGVGERTQQRAVEILRQTAGHGATVSKHPMGLAAAALYMAGVMCNEKRPQEMIADAAGVTGVTVRVRYQDLRKMCRSKEAEA